MPGNTNINRAVMTPPSRPVVNSNQTFNRPAMNEPRPTMNASPRPMAQNPNFSRGPQQTYRPQPQVNNQPRPNFSQPRPQPQVYRPEPQHMGGGGGRPEMGGGHGGHGR